jgi:hypothetical protein
MHSHPNARLTQRGRLRLVIQQLEHGRSLAELTAENGISLRCAYRWLARLLQAPFSTVARVLSRLGLGRLRNLDPKPPVQRYEWDR